MLMISIRFTIIIQRYQVFSDYFSFSMFSLTNECVPFLCINILLYVYKHFRCFISRPPIVVFFSLENVSFPVYSCGSYVLLFLSSIFVSALYFGSRWELFNLFSHDFHLVRTYFGYFAGYSSLCDSIFGGFSRFSSFFLLRIFSLVDFVRFFSETSSLFFGVLETFV